MVEFRRRVEQGEEPVADQVAVVMNPADEDSRDDHVIFVAGFITTANLIGNGLLALLHSPAEFDHLWADGSLVPSAVEEMLRFDPPVQLVERQALDDIDLGDRTIPAGATIVALLRRQPRPAAVRRPRPARRRPPRRQRARELRLGNPPLPGRPPGPPRGAPGVRPAPDRFRHLELLEPDPPRRAGLGFRSLVRLPVRFTAR